MKQKVVLLMTFLCIVAVYMFSIHIGVSAAQVAANEQNDLRGENMGEYIMLWWSNHAGTSEYVLYRSMTVSGPWTEIGRVDEEASRTGGPKIDRTADARLMDLCYKVEAVYANGLLIRTYQPMCVPVFLQ